MAATHLHTPLPIFHPSICGHCQIIDAEFVGAQGNGLGFLVAAQWESASRLSDDCQQLTRSSQCPLWDISRPCLARFGTTRGRGKSGRCGNRKKSSASHTDPSCSCDSLTGLCESGFPFSLPIAVSIRPIALCSPINGDNSMLWGDAVHERIVNFMPRTPLRIMELLCAGQLKSAAEVVERDVIPIFDLRGKRPDIQLS